MQKALITGGSSGIGLELAKIMAKKGHDLVLCSRDKESIKKVSSQIEKEFDVKVSYFQVDLSKPGSAKVLYNKVKSENIEILVNNAGVGYVADFFDGDIERNIQMAHLNMISVMELCHYFGKDFKEANKGRILNVCSIVAFLPGPAQPVYYATKAFVRSLSRTLAYNLSTTDVTVTALHPGVTKTRFFDEASAPKQRKGADPESVARLGYDAMMAGKIEVTHGLRNKFLTNIFVRFTPYKMQARIVDTASEV